MGIKIVKEKKAKDFTFIDDGLNLEQTLERKGSESKKEKAERDFRLMDNSKVNKLRKSRITGGHSKQGHSAVYE